MCVDASRSPKGNEVSWHVVRLNDIMDVVVVKVSPTTTLDVQFAPVALCANTVPGDERESRRRFESRDIAHLEPVCSVSEAARELEFRRGPLRRASRNAKMQCTAFVGPHVRW